MLSIVKSMSLQGLEGYLVDVQVDVSAGMPNWEVVGLPDATVKESKERVRTAIKNSGFDFQSRKIVINLAPADTRKEGSFFDLPIAIGILLDFKDIKWQNLEDTVFIGELSLNGKINKINGVLPMCIEAKKLGIKRVILSEENAQEAAIVSGLKVIGATDLRQVVEYLNNNEDIEQTETNIQDIFNKKHKYAFDFSEVKGQENIKRALEVAAARTDITCLWFGAPGSGKTMLARRIPTILPDLTFEESLEITKIHSIAGLLSRDTPILLERPFRSPHHTVTVNSLVGGGKIPKPGEISLAHFGVLFLDELPEFNKNTLEVLRGPLEDREVTISRVNASLTYPCNFMFVASMNPCPCGFYGSKEKECTCTPEAISRYMSKISGPLLDRIDIQVEVTPVKYQKLESSDRVETSEEIKERVDRARKIQLERYKEHGIFSNSELTPHLSNIYCKLDLKSKEIVQNAFERLGLSARGYGRILKVARTIADLDVKENIEAKHIAEAIQYRSLDRKYWQ